MNLFDMFESGKKQDIEEACWKGYHKEGMKTMFGKRYPNCVKNKNESLETYINKGECPGCGGTMVSEEQFNEKQDACYHKVKSRYKVWPSAYASGALVQCRKKGANNWGNKSEGALNEFAPNDNGDSGEEDTLLKYAKLWYNGDLEIQQQVEKLLDRMGWEIGEIESEEGGAFVVQPGDEHGRSYIGWTAADLIEEQLDENLRQWFSDKWVRFGPDGKIRGDCARGDDSEGKPKCLPQSKAHSLGKKGRASAAARKRREDPNPERSGKAINVATKKKSNEGVAEGSGKIFTVVYYSKQTDRNVTRQIKASSESELWDRLRAKGIDVVSIEEQGVAEGSVWSSADQKMKHHSEFPHTHTAVKDIRSSMTDKIIVPKGARLSALGNDNYLNLDTGVQPFKLDPTSLVKQGVAEGQLNELAPNPGGGDGGGRDDGDDGFELPLDFKGQNILVWPRNKKHSMGDTATPFPRGERFTGKVYIMWDRPKIEAIFYLDPKDREDREAEYERVYGPQGRGWEDWLDHKWYDTTTPRYRFVTDWRLIPAKEPGGWPGIVDAWGQDMKGEVMNYPESFITEIIQKDGDGRHFVEPRQNVAEGSLNEFAPTKFIGNFNRGDGGAGRGGGDGDDDRNERDDSDDEGIINKILQALERLQPDPFETYGGEVEDVVVNLVSNGRLDDYVRAVGMGNIPMKELIKQGVIQTLKELKELYGDQGVAEGGPFSYGVKKPRQGSVVDLAAKKRKEQDKNYKPIEPKDQMVGTAKVTKGVAEGSNKKQEATRRIQKMLNDKFGANLDVDGILGPLTLKSINKFMPNAKVEPAEDPNKTTAVQGKKVKNENIDQNQLAEKWSQKYKRSIDCSNPKGFSQRAHCDGKKKNEAVNESKKYYSVIGTDPAVLRKDFNMSKDRNGWYLKENSTPKQKLDVYRAFGNPI